MDTDYIRNLIKSLASIDKKNCLYAGLNSTLSFEQRSLVVLQMLEPFSSFQHCKIKLNLKRLFTIQLTIVDVMNGKCKQIFIYFIYFVIKTLDPTVESTLCNYANEALLLISVDDENIINFHSCSDHMWAGRSNTLIDTFTAVHSNANQPNDSTAESMLVGSIVGSRERLTVN